MTKLGWHHNEPDQGNLADQSKVGEAVAFQ